MIEIRKSLPVRLRELEIELITHALFEAKNIRAHAAHILGVPRPTLVMKMRKYGMLKERPSPYTGGGRIRNNCCKFSNGSG